MVAAANDDIEVWGVDFNPAHIDVAQSLAERAGLDNCYFVEASFEQFGADSTLGPGEVDVIVVNGVYSWISGANQNRIGEIVRQRLRPGGLAYVMYEVSLGWASLTPVTEALRLHASTGRRRPEVAFSAAAESLRNLADLGARYFPLPPAEAERMESWASADGYYAAHEYLGSNFGPSCSTRSPAPWPTRGAASSVPPRRWRRTSSTGCPTSCASCSSMSTTWFCAR